MHRDRVWKDLEMWNDDMLEVLFSRSWSEALAIEWTGLRGGPGAYKSNEHGVETEISDELYNKSTHQKSHRRRKQSKRKGTGKGKGKGQGERGELTKHRNV